MNNKKVTNTAKTPRFEWLFGGNPNAIETQELQGQKELLESSQLPIKVNSPRGINAEEQYDLMGIKVVEKTEEDELFLTVKLPSGWKIERTDHSLWTKLVDDKGRQRGTIFYKAAFYDRDSFINFSTRYNWQGNYERKHFVSYIVKDFATDQIIFETQAMSQDVSQPDYFKKQDDLQEQCKDFLKENYPDHENINAYWD